ncbi:cyclin-domain-containing protein [Hesseltinella vesiculosa]|uniref:Cyclin-domain-containing protein n=1 Tax=Hesseltinella vesiculosa TaxID=101127 RepID=A0A1X2GYH8_9FUNG|nr:cyclin-domain-containing protein [Hesseltinella vesiculosa]
MPSATFYHQRFDLVHHPVKETIAMLTGLLEKITKTNDRIQRSHPPSSLTCFHARAIPSIDIGAYLLRILKYCPCANECFLSLLVYFDRMARNVTQLRLDSWNVHRLLIAGIMVSSKFFSDVYYTNTRYAKVGGLPVKELNALELEFLRMNDFILNIQVEELQRYGDQLLLHHQRELFLRHLDDHKPATLDTHDRFSSHDLHPRLRLPTPPLVDDH